MAEQAEQQKKTKYADLLTTHHFVPIGIKTTSVFGPEALSFLKELGRRLRAHSGDPLSFSHILQQIGVTIQQGNTAAVLKVASKFEQSFFCEGRFEVETYFPCVPCM